MNKRSENTIRDGAAKHSNNGRVRSLSKRAEMRINHGYQYLHQEGIEAENITQGGVAILASLSPDVIAMAGSDIRLSCFVHNIQNKTVNIIDNIRLKNVLQLILVPHS